MVSDRCCLKFRFSVKQSPFRSAVRIILTTRRMGTHPSGPAMLAADPATSLQDWLEQHSQALGPTVLKRFGLKLPFLFKVPA